MQTQQKHPRNVTGVYHVQKVSSDGEVTTYPDQYNHLTYSGMRHLSERWTASNGFQYTINSNDGFYLRNTKITPVEEVQPLLPNNPPSGVIYKKMTPTGRGVVHDSNDSNRVGLTISLTYLATEAYDIRSFAIGSYIHTDYSVYLLSVNNILDERGRDSVISLNRGDTVLITYTLWIKFEPKAHTLNLKRGDVTHITTITPSRVGVGYQSNILKPLTIRNAMMYGTKGENISSFSYGTMKITFLNRTKNDNGNSGFKLLTPDDEYKSRVQLVITKGGLNGDVYITHLYFETDSIKYTFNFNPPLPITQKDIYTFEFDFYVDPEGP